MSDADPLPETATYDRLIRALGGLALLATVVGVGRHLVEALIGLTPETGTFADQLAAIPPQAWMFAGFHLVLAVLSLGVGYLLISCAYPRRGLARMAASNPAAAIQACAHLLGAGVIATVSWGGCDAQSLLISATFCALGWLALIVIGAAHRLVTQYHDHEEIAAGNSAAALASAGLHLAIALVVGHAITGDFLSWRASLTSFAVALAWALALYPLRQLVLARIILRMTPREMDAAIMLRRDHGLGAAEGLCYVISALILAPGW